MAASTKSQVGGSVGEIRSAIDVDALNAYLEKNVQELRTPVAVKQFQVRFVSSIAVGVVAEGPLTYSMDK